MSRSLDAAITGTGTEECMHWQECTLDKTYMRTTYKYMSEANFMWP